MSTTKISDLFKSNSNKPFYLISSLSSLVQNIIRVESVLSTELERIRNLTAFVILSLLLDMICALQYRNTLLIFLIKMHQENLLDQYM